MADQLANYFYTSSMKVILVSRMEQEEPEIAVVGTKGQIVIPQRFRRELKITPKTKPTEKEILEVIQAYRREKRTKQGT